MRTTLARSLLAISILTTLAALPASEASAQAAAEPSPGAGPSAEEIEFGRVLQAISWTKGPERADIGREAQIAVLPNMRFTAGDGTRKMMELMHNPTDGSELGLVTNEDLDWFVTFEFSDIGYVKDADKEKLDAR